LSYLHLNELSAKLITLIKSFHFDYTSSLIKIRRRKRRPIPKVKRAKHANSKSQGSAAPAIKQAGANRALVVGVDGGGTKTRAVVMDGDRIVRGEGLAGASNPLRVGVHTAVAAIREAVDKACDAASASRAEIMAAQVGLAGARREDLRASVRKALTQSLGIHRIEIVTDADIALYGATAGEPGVVVIAGTGSIGCGLNRRKVHACMGGWGPLAGDEGSGSWIARRALQGIAHAADGRGAETSLVRAACDYFHVAKPYDLLLALYAPSMTHSRIAGFSRHVVEEAKKRDMVARRIIVAAGTELGEMAAALIRRLQMQRDHFSLVTVGGVFAAGALVLNPMKREVSKVAPHARFSLPLMEPAVAAAHMAHEHLLQRLPLAS
jgi:N-acetylglucosamine kinase-like BadF-type ATPase